MKSKFRLWFLGTAGCLALAALWMIVAVPGTALAKKPEGGGGGGGDKVSGKKQEIKVVVTFRDHMDDRVQSDGLGPYFTDRKTKAKVFIGLGGQLRFGTGSSRSTMLNFADAFDLNVCLPFVEGQAGGMTTLGGPPDENGALTSEQLNPGAKGDRWDLTRMTPGQSARIGLIMTFGFEGILWILQWGDEAGLTGLVTVVGGPDSNNDGFSDSWDIEAGAGPDDLAALYFRDFDANTNILCNFAFVPFAVMVEKE